jgi:hypothetical protein
MLPSRSPQSRDEQWPPSSLAFPASPTAIMRKGEKNHTKPAIDLPFDLGPQRMQSRTGHLPTRGNHTGRTIEFWCGLRYEVGLRCDRCRTH